MILVYICLQFWSRLLFRMKSSRACIRDDSDMICAGDWPVLVRPEPDLEMNPAYMIAFASWKNQSTRRTTKQIN